MRHQDASGASDEEQRPRQEIIAERLRRLDD